MFKVTTSGLPACMQPPTFSRRRHMPVAYWKDNFRVRVSLGSAETLVRRGGIINHHSIAYSLSNISAKNYQNRLMSVESIVCNISVVFLETQCRRVEHVALTWVKWHVVMETGSRWNGCVERLGGVVSRKSSVCLKTMLGLGTSSEWESRRQLTSCMKTLCVHVCCRGNVDYTWCLVYYTNSWHILFYLKQLLFTRNCS